MEYTKLDSEMQRSHIEDQIAFLERQHFDTKLKIDMLSATNLPDPEQLKQLRANLLDFEAMHSVATKSIQD